MVFILFASIFFLLAFVFLDLSHEFLKRQIRRVSARKLDEPNPQELDYPFFKFAGSGSSYALWRRFSRAEIQLTERDDFIRQTAPDMFDKFILQERLLRLMFGTSICVVALDVLAVAVHLIRR